MKRVAVIPLSFGFLLLWFSPVFAVSYGDWYSSVVTAADVMLSYQNSDGSFDYKKDADPLNSGPINTQGAIARGLVAAYRATGNTKYLEAANKVAKWLKTNSTKLTNKDIEFLYELADSGGIDYTDFAEDQAITTINDLVDFTDHDLDTGSEAIYNRYLDLGLDSGAGAASGIMNGIKLWMIGEWGHVASLLGVTAIYLDYTGTQMASEIGTLVTDYFHFYEYLNDYYGTLGLVGIIEGAASGGIGTFGENEDEALAALIGKNTTGWQDTGYKTYALSLYGIYSPDKLTNWINHGYFTAKEGKDYLEPLGEALLGVSSAPVPEPSTILLFGLGILAIARSGRKRSGD